MKYSRYPRDMGRYESLIRFLWSGLPLHSRGLLDTLAKFLKLAMVVSMIFCLPVFLATVFLAPDSWRFLALAVFSPFVLCPGLRPCRGDLRLDPRT